MIGFQAVSKSYGHVEAVRDLTLEVRAGELFGFLGPNGAGKTTTIKMATGMLQPTSGRILIAGHDVYEDGNAARSLIGYVPDRPYVYDKLSGREFLEFVADLYSVDPRQSRPRASELLELFGMSEHGEQLLESYSHGMRQKLIMASVLIHDPKVIFLDEPTTALDPRSARLVKEILRGLCERGATVFMSTQVMEIAERMCDRVAIIDRGELVATGTIEELRQAESSRQPGKGSLEDVFLALTGGAEARNWVHILGEPES